MNNIELVFTNKTVKKGYIKKCAPINKKDIPDILTSLGVNNINNVSLACCLSASDAFNDILLKSNNIEDINYACYLYSVLSEQDKDHFNMLIKHKNKRYSLEMLINMLNDFDKYKNYTSKDNIGVLTNFLLNGKKIENILPSEYKLNSYAI